MSAYTVLCTYLVMPEKVEEVRELLRRHWPTLRKHGFVTEEPATVYFGEDSAGPFFVEILTWVDSSASGKAYWTPEVSEIWSGLYAFTASRGERPGIEYPKVHREDWFAGAPQPVAVGHR